MSRAEGPPSTAEKLGGRCPPAVVAHRPHHKIHRGGGDGRTDKERVAAPFITRTHRRKARALAEDLARFCGCSRAGSSKIWYGADGAPTPPLAQSPRPRAARSSCQRTLDREREIPAPGADRRCVPARSSRPEAATPALHRGERGEPRGSAVQRPRHVRRFSGVGYDAGRRISAAPPMTEGAKKFRAGFRIQRAALKMYP